MSVPFDERSAGFTWFFSLRTSFRSLPLIFSISRFFIPSVFNPYEIPKFIVFVGITWLLGFFFLYKTIEQGKALQLRPYLLTSTILMYALIVFIADVTGVDPKISFLGSIYRYQGFLLLLSCLLFYFVVKTVKQSQKQAEQIFTRYLFISTVIICGYAIVQGLLWYGLRFPYIPTSGGRIIGTMGNPNVLAGYMVMLLPFILYAKKLSKNKKTLLTSMLLITVVFTDSRTGMLAVTIVLSSALLVQVFKRFSKKIMFLIICVMLCLLFLVLMMGKQSLLLKRTSVWDNRPYLWQTVLDGVIKRPLLGYGQENVEFLFPKTYAKVDNAHNIFLEVAGASGLVGLILFVCILAIGLKGASSPVRLALFTFLIIAQFNPLSIPQIVLFWYLLAVEKI